MVIFNQFIFLSALFEAVRLCDFEHLSLLHHLTSYGKFIQKNTVVDDGCFVN